MSQGTRKRNKPNKPTNINFSPGPMKVVKTSKVVRSIPQLPQNLGMSCTRPGYIRYLDEMRSRLDKVRYENKRINVRYLEYSDSLNRGVVVNTSEQLLNMKPKLEFRNNGSPVSKLDAPSGSIHYFLVSITKRDNPDLGHAINVLMDTGNPEPRIWVFDPHGRNAMNRNGFGSILRNRVLPNMKKMFGRVFNNTTAKYYTGPNLQANNTRGVCTTFHIDFAQAIPALLNETANIRTFGGRNLNIAGRSRFLNNPTLFSNVTGKRITKQNTKTPPKLTMTMGAVTKKKTKKKR
jgi:hypothetical protein